MEYFYSVVLVVLLQQRIWILLPPLAACEVFKENPLHSSQSICVSVGCLQLWQTATSTSLESVYGVADVDFVECQNWQAVVGIPPQVNMEVNYLQYTTYSRHPLCYCDLEQQTESKAALGKLLCSWPWPWIEREMFIRINKISYHSVGCGTSINLSLCIWVIHCRSHIGRLS